MATITSREKDYSQWYIDIITQAKLADYSPIKGCMVIRPRGYAIWERMQYLLDQAFKKTGVENAYFPMLIPQSFLEKEKEHVAGFSPQCATVTHGGGEKLHEPLVLRPTSETIIWSMYKDWIKSWRDLPLIINQWANVVRWEKRTRLFLRTTEFLWQEGHTAHSSEEEAQNRTLQMLEVYRNFAENYMAMPVIAGKKSDSEKFSGAVHTYSIEAMMQDKKALQAGTSHNLGQNFSLAFNVQYQDKQGKLQHVWATSWGVSTRLIGALIMTHSDDRGLILPPKIAPHDVAIIPIFRTQNKTKVLNFTENLTQKLKEQGLRVILDKDESTSPGFKFAESELTGIPLRLEIGERDIDAHTYTLVRRDTLTKQPVAENILIETIKNSLTLMQSDLYNKALTFQKENTHAFNNYKDLYDFYSCGNDGFVQGFWCGNPQCELKIKKETKATIRNIPLKLNEKSQQGTCIICQKTSNLVAIWAQSY